MQFSPETVRAQVRRILASEFFARSRRMQRFLEFIVEETLAGRADGLGEYAIGSFVYDRGADFEPALDPIVRNDARRLRVKLREYYLQPRPRAMDELIIEMPKGAYIPVFRSSACDDGRKNTTNDRPRRIAVLPFDALPGTMEALSYGRALCMSMTAGLCGLDGVEAVAHGYLAGLSIREAAAEMGLSHAIHGCVLHSADCRRVTVHLIQTIDGTQLWAREYEFRDEESIARQTEIVRDVRREVAALLAVSFPQPRRLAMAA